MNRLIYKGCEITASTLPMHDGGWTVEVHILHLRESTLGGVINKCFTIKETFSRREDAIQSGFHHGKQFIDNIHGGE